MFQKVLIANRGEIALRILRACRELGVRTVAVYSEADRDSLPVRLADESYCVGPAPSSRSYLNIPNIISAALLSGADAIHPGYGYLAERADFAEICESHGLVFIGPPASAIESMGDKLRARQRVREAGVPVLPGSDGPVSDEQDAVRVAEAVGYPVMVKAAAGGGGRGMRVARTPEELRRVLQAARAEAESAFGDGTLYLEQLLPDARHIEVQVLADQYGHMVHLGERECSIQRRHQKIVEEAPSPMVDEALRRRMGEAALRVARAVTYVNAGTVEFLVDPEGHFYFLEMNTRVQVEHGVTEMVTGVDLVKAQIRIAAGEELTLAQEDIRLDGHAIECRVNCEDPETFTPSPGTITGLWLPGGPGVRVDTAIYAGYTVPPYYDSLLAKLMAWGQQREEAVARMASALAELRIEGVRTNVEFLRRVVSSPEFGEGRLSTDFVERVMHVHVPGGR
ncbi:acetyl-CoA carboxylase biotin carboxylase subunit [Carboxydochorda subterranea]|uniref:Biotin carboxylase n=1 Tax=Carboxydichorda subterranea TaxID=3109565 RepID=A0ABZ1BZV1_9FIRM|nr:acetyl-CoA carboxylase biotin carboxylase subunit [Limnochorda sp. L945t]WRP18327.1 acetyl-CoA carboxylase biotin carboxylase subunit [Limnochorda sp. L945t]